MAKKSELLIDDGELLILQTKLAVVVGDRQAIALQQVHYWCGINQKADKVEHYADDQWWVYNTWNEWQEKNFPFWSVSTVRRVFHDLEADGLLITRPHEHRNKGAWVTINYGALELFMKTHESQPKVKRPHSRENSGSVQNEQTGSVQNEQAGLTKVNRQSDQSEQTTGNTENTEITSEVVVTRPRQDSSPLPPNAINFEALYTPKPQFNDTIAWMERPKYYRAFEAGFPPTAKIKLPDTKANREAADALYHSDYTPEEITETVRDLIQQGKVALRFDLIMNDMSKRRLTRNPVTATPVSNPETTIDDLPGADDFLPLDENGRYVEDKSA